MKPVRVGTIVNHLKEHGIECIYMSGSYVSMYWRGEDIGNIYQSEGNPPKVHINADLAAVAGPNPDSVDIEIYREDWKETLDAAVYHLQGSEERFVDMTRAKRVRNIQRYFKEKKERYTMTIMGRIEDALKEVGTAFMELKDDKEDTCN